MKKSTHLLKQSLSTQATCSMEVYVANSLDLSSTSTASATYISTIHNAEATLRSSRNAVVHSNKNHCSRRRRMNNIKVLSKFFFIQSAVPTRRSIYPLVQTVSHLSTS